MTHTRACCVIAAADHLWALRSAPFLCSGNHCFASRPKNYITSCNVSPLSASSQILPLFALTLTTPCCPHFTFDFGTQSSTKEVCPHLLAIGGNTYTQLLLVVVSSIDALKEGYSEDLSESSRRWWLAGSSGPAAARWPGHHLVQTRACGGP